MEQTPSADKNCEMWLKALEKLENLELRSFFQTTISKGQEQMFKQFGDSKASESFFFSK